MDKGAYSYGNPEIKWSDYANLTIGKFSSIAGGVKIYLGGGHRTDWITTYPFGHINTHIFNSFSGLGHPSTNGNVTIGNDVWIADNVTIMSGVTIGDGAVIASNSHVVKNVEPYSIAGGNPAKHIKFRFSQSKIEKLLFLKWWDLSNEQINKIAPLLCSTNIDELIKTLEHGI